MRVVLSCALAAVILTGAFGFAAAQSLPQQAPDQIPETPAQRPSAVPAPVLPSAEIRLTPEQKTAILNAVRQDKKAAATEKFPTDVGAQVPPALELYLLPDGAVATVPEARMLKYTLVNNQVVLVDPTTMRVVDVIGQ